MKLSRTHKNIVVKWVVPALLVLGFVFGLTVKQPVNAVSKKKVAGIVVGAATGGVIAGVAGGAKWVPVGIAGGGVVGGVVGHNLKGSHDSYEKLTDKKEHLERQLKNPNSASKRERLERKLADVNHQLDQMGQK